MRSFRLLLVWILILAGILHVGLFYTDIENAWGAENYEAVAIGEVTTQAGIPVAPSEFNDDVRNLPYYPYRSTVVEKPYRPLRRGPAASKYWPQSYIPDYASPVEPAAPIPAPVLSFAGMSRTSICTGGQCGTGWPPDVNGEVGPKHYIQAVNSGYAIYNKSGTLLASFTEDNLWAGSGQPPCDGNSQGDPIVVYDSLGDRWILTHFAFPVDGSGIPTSPFYQCIAVSKTSDPVSGGWWLYAVRMDPGSTGFPPVGTINDYSKFGIWPDCLYMSANEFTEPAGTFAGTFIAAFSRSDLEAGRTLTWNGGFLDFPTYNIFTMLPSNILGSAPGSLPPAGSPNYFVSESQTDFGFEVRKYSTSNNCGAGIFDALNPVLVGTPDYNFNIGSDVPQPGTAIKLDTVGDRLLQKARYRKIGTTESLWVVHNVADGPPLTTVRAEWAQIDVTGGTVSPTAVQLQTYAPDSTIHRWMGSLAVDKEGNMALGYSISSGSTFPSIAYSGRLASDPINTLPQTETILVAGAGSQTNDCGGSPCNRWGDYSAMSVDPSDDCTFWYTNEYYDSPANGTSGNWQTRIGAFRFSTCDPSGLVKKMSNAFLFSDIVGALATLTGDDTLRLQSITFYEDITISNFIVTLDGGYNPGSNFLVRDSFSAAKSLTVAGGTAAAVVSALSIQ